MTRIMILPFGDVLVGKSQFIGFSNELKWYLYWYRDGKSTYQYLVEKINARCSK
jgi:hypothetical protein